METDIEFDGAPILITGDTGSFGHHFARTEVKLRDPVMVIIDSRDDLRQFQIHNARSFVSQREQERRFISDNLRRAAADLMEDVSIVIDAALERVPVAEYSPLGAVKANNRHAENVINAAVAGDQRVAVPSTDKAAPINPNGATKLASDKQFVAANDDKGKRDIRFAVVRYVNVIGSRGSVIPLFLNKATDGVRPVADRRMTCFNIPLREGVEMVLNAPQRIGGGELFVPKIASYRVLDLAAAIAPEAEAEFVGIRPGETLHEDMLPATESLSSVEFHDCFVLLPLHHTWDTNELCETACGAPVRVSEPYPWYESDLRSSFAVTDGCSQPSRTETRKQRRPPTPRSPVNRQSWGIWALRPRHVKTTAMFWWTSNPTTCSRARDAR